MWKRVIEFLNLEFIINPDYQNSRDDAKSRLKLVLMHDRSEIAPGVMEKMKEELIEVISRYVEIDKETLDLKIETESNTLALVANIPIISAQKKAAVS